MVQHAEAADLSGKTPSKNFFSAMRDVTKAVVERKERNYRDDLSASISPPGNMYRFCGFSAERLKHTADLRQQLHALADEHREVLGGSNTSREQRVEALIAALQNVVVRCKTYGVCEKGTLPGFQPLLEFVDVDVLHVGPFLLPVNDLWRHVGIVFMTLIVLGVQVLAPLLVVANRWGLKTNPLRDGEFSLASVTVARAFCFESSLFEQLVTLMEVLLTIIVIFITRMYAEEQAQHAVKSGRLPTDVTWMLTGIFANMWCCCLIVIAVPLLFWSEDTPANTVLDCMTLLFVFKLDDFSDVLGSNLVRWSDADFQSFVAWSVALLSQCPVRVADLVNSSAKNIRDVWQVELADGRLMVARSCDGLSQVCETRISTAESTESQALLVPPAASIHDVYGASAIKYYAPSVIFQNRSITLPSCFTEVINGAWYIIGCWLAILQIMAPVLFVVAHECKK
eukprot:TRINITY_DN1772_c2_g1_i1.p1 TRINITY_DN1772_c2_g1~~TRINITY_DN1772_c2_g1_i1.p1  ORF type:complete len:454 (-),score=63.31 TRINITY_DN1772_c2_g1_i1:71-1432(-)